MSSTRGRTGSTESEQPLDPDPGEARKADPGDEAAPPTPEEREIADEDGEAVADGQATTAEEAPAGEAAGQAPTPDEPPRAVVPRWVQLATLPIALLFLWVVINLAGKVLLIFVVGALVALILNPIVSGLHRTRLPRGLSVLAVYLVFFLILGAIGVLVANPISNQVSSFSKNLPHLVSSANKNLADFQSTLNKHGLDVHFIKTGKTALQTLEDKVKKAAGSLVSFGGDLVTKVASTVFDLVIIFVVSVYMLIYGPTIGALVRRLLPPGDGTHADDYPTLIQNAVARYVGGQLLFSVVMGTTAGVALLIYGLLGVFPDGRTYAIAFGAFMGFMELIPYVGPILGAIPPILVALFTDPITALWVALLFLGLQQLEGHIVSPQIFGRTLRINPLLVILALLLGEQVDGIIGALLALPLLSVLRETVVYLSRHLAFEPWSRPPDPML